VGEDLQTIFANQILTFSSGVDSRIIGMKTESLALRCWSQLEEACKDIVTVVLDVIVSKTTNKIRNYHFVKS
jgi:hypothetical protein